MNSPPPHPHHQRQSQSPGPSPSHSPVPQHMFPRRMHHESYVQCPQCPTRALSEPNVDTSRVITGCPNCSSIKRAFTDRTVLDQKMNQFYMTAVMPKLDYDLLSLKFQY